MKLSNLHKLKENVQEYLKIQGDIVRLEGELEERLIIAFTVIFEMCFIAFLSSVLLLQLSLGLGFWMNGDHYFGFLILSAALALVLFTFSFTRKMRFYKRGVHRIIQQIVQNIIKGRDESRENTN
jgi:pilus assembly protein TadC